MGLRSNSHPHSRHKMATDLSPRRGRRVKGQAQKWWGTDVGTFLALGGARIRRHFRRGGGGGRVRERLDDECTGILPECD
ncbi:hypothetical protein R6Z07F_012555 [Ovis aries]